MNNSHKLAVDSRRLKPAEFGRQAQPMSAHTGRRLSMASFMWELFIFGYRSSGRASNVGKTLMRARLQRGRASNAGAPPTRMWIILRKIMK